MLEKCEELQKVWEAKQKELDGFVSRVNVRSVGDNASTILQPEDEETIDRLTDAADEALSEWNDCLIKIGAAISQG